MSERNKFGQEICLRRTNIYKLPERIPWYVDTVTANDDDTIVLRLKQKWPKACTTSVAGLPHRRKQWSYKALTNTTFVHIDLLRCNPLKRWTMETICFRCKTSSEMCSNAAVHWKPLSQTCGSIVPPLDEDVDMLAVRASDHCMSVKSISSSNVNIEHDND